MKNKNLTTFITGGILLGLAVGLNYISNKLKKYS